MIDECHWGLYFSKFCLYVQSQLYKCGRRLRDYSKELKSPELRNFIVSHRGAPFPYKKKLGRYSDLVLIILLEYEIHMSPVAWHPIQALSIKTLKRMMSQFSITWLHFQESACLFVDVSILRIKLGEWHNDNSPRVFETLWEKQGPDIIKEITEGCYRGP